MNYCEYDSWDLPENGYCLTHAVTVSLTNIRLACKHLIETNTLAYFVHILLTLVVDTWYWLTHKYKIKITPQRNQQSSLFCIHFVWKKKKFYKIAIMSNLENSKILLFKKFNRILGMSYKTFYGRELFRSLVS